MCLPQYREYSYIYTARVQGFAELRLNVEREQPVYLIIHLQLEYVCRFVEFADGQHL